MAENQRKKERKERKNAKNKKRITILWIIIIVAAAVIAVMKISEINFSALFQQKSSENSIVLSEDTDKKSGFPYRMEAGENNVLTVVGSRLALLNDSSYTVIDSDDAQEYIKDEHGYANPIIKTSGGYSVIYDQGGTVYRLDSQKETVYENSAEGEILCADVADTGTVAVVSVSGVHKSRICVCGKSFSEKMNFEISGGYVTAAAIDDRGRNVAFVVMNSENAEIKSTLYTMSVKDAEPRAKFEYTGSSVLDIHFSSGYLYVVGNNFVSVISSLEKETPVYGKGSMNTVSYCYDPADNLVIAYSEYIGAPVNKLSYVRQNGKIKTTVDVNSEIKDVSASGTDMTVLTGSEIISYKLSNGSERLRVQADNSYSDIQQLSSKIYARHRSVLEIVSE